MATEQVLLHLSIFCQPRPLLLLSHGRPCNVLRAIVLSPKASDLSVREGGFRDGGS